MCSLASRNSSHAFPGSQDVLREFRLYKPKAANTKGGDWGNRCCCSTELSAWRQSDKNDQDFQGDMVGMPPAARKGHRKREVISSPGFIFAF